MEALKPRICIIETLLSIVKKTVVSISFVPDNYANHLLILDKIKDNTGWPVVEKRERFACIYRSPKNV
jgi:hypothetical protein